MESIDLDLDMGNNIFDDSDQEMEDVEQIVGDALQQNQNENDETLDESITAKPEVPKRKVVRQVRPKLNHERICGPRGIPILPELMDKLKFRGKGYEKEDLNLLMKTLEHWAHRLFPKLPFDDMLDRIEKLGKKKPVQNCLKKIRLDIPVLFEIDAERDQALADQLDARLIANDEPGTTNNDLINTDTSKNNNNNENILTLNDDFDEIMRDSQFDNANNKSSVSNQLPAAPVVPEIKQLTEEQLRKIEESKRIAMEKRKARLQQNNKDANASQSANSETVQDSQVSAMNIEQQTQNTSPIKNNSNSDGKDDATYNEDELMSMLDTEIQNSADS